MMTFTERVKQESFQAGVQRGVLQGEQRGEQRGVQQGGARIPLRQHTLKFGSLPPTIQQLVSEADADTLLTWSERVLTASTLNEILKKP
jgi:hypothetical protein